MILGTMFQIWFFILFLCTCMIPASYAGFFYDATRCSTDSFVPGTRYTCDSGSKNSCQTFLVYRANENFPNISNISALFGLVPDELLAVNGMGSGISSSSQILVPGRDVLVPINCSCLGGFFAANFSYKVSTENTTINDIACGLYEGLVKSITLLEENPPQENILKVGSKLNVPLKCACPDHNLSSNARVVYFVTYPFVQGDSVDKVSKKFDVPIDDILVANNLQHDTTIYPNTTILVPLKSKPFINPIFAGSPPPPPDFLPTIPVERAAKGLKLKAIYIAVSVVGFCMVLVTLIVCGVYVKALNKCKADLVIHSTRRSSFNSFSTPRVSGSPRSGISMLTRSSPSSCLSPDLLVGIKYSLQNFSHEEIKTATRDFSEDIRLSGSVYKGSIDNIEVIIKCIKLEEVRHVIDIHSKINHVNIVKLLGVCYNEEPTWSYLVFEFPANGCLRDCLANRSVTLDWTRRTQIAFDTATSLHYLHYCMVPPYTHVGVSCVNIFITHKWRAKLAVSQSLNPRNLSFGSSSEYEVIDLLRVTEKEDIFSFGVVLLEIISGREGVDGELLRESIGFLGGEVSEGGCFEQLRNFMDPSLKDYPLAEALCLAVLAKACVEDDPMHRPCMDDIIKVLARMVN